MPPPPIVSRRIDEQLTALAQTLDATSRVEIRDGRAWLVNSIGQRDLGRTRREARVTLTAHLEWLRRTLATATTIR